MKPIAWIKDREITAIIASAPYNVTSWKTNLGLIPEPGDTPLYLHPPRREWVGLTPEEIDSVMPYCPDEFDLAEFKDFAQAIEAKLKEKNT